LNYCTVCAAPVALRIPDDDNRPRHVCTACGEIHYVNPKVVVGCLPVIGDKVLLCRRAIEPRYGKWTLPAGFLECGETLEAGALRETHEEIGIPPASLEVLGPLDDVHTMASGFTVSPWVAHHPGGRPAMTPQDSEIARIMEVSLREVMAADRRIPAVPDLRTLRYPLHGEDVWGLTARILRTFADVVHRLTPPGARS